MKIHVINTGYFKLDELTVWCCTKIYLEKTNPPDNNNMCSWAMRCLLIEMKEQLILIDME